MAIATPFGLIWSGLVVASGMVANVGLSAVSAIYARSAEEAANAWAIVGTIQDRIGGGVELVGGPGCCFEWMTRICALRALLPGKQLCEQSCGSYLEKHHER